MCLYRVPPKLTFSKLVLWNIKRLDEKFIAYNPISKNIDVLKDYC